MRTGFLSVSPHLYPRMSFDSKEGAQGTFVESVDIFLYELNNILSNITIRRDKIILGSFSMKLPLIIISKRNFKTLNYFKVLGLLKRLFQERSNLVNNGLVH